MIEVSCHTKKPKPTWGKTHGLEAFFHGNAQVTHIHHREWIKPEFITTCQPYSTDVDNFNSYDVSRITGRYGRLAISGTKLRFTCVSLAPGKRFDSDDKATFAPQLHSH